MPPPVQQSDPWAEAAKNYRPQASSGSAPVAMPNEDWKLWQQQDSAPSDTRNGLQKAVDLASSGQIVDPNLPAWSQRIASGMTKTLLQPLVHPEQTAKSIYDTIVDTDHPNESVLDQAKRSGINLVQSGKATLANIRQNGIMPSLETGVGEAGGILAGGELLGGAKNLGELIPSRARAGDMFESLNTQLANHPAPLNAALKPLQRITEIGERGSVLPPAVNKLLVRSQAIEPMTFPEARDYQASLSDLSRSDKLAMNGRVRGALSQLNKGLYQDLRDSASQAGQGDVFDSAMRQYRQASRINNTAKNVAKYGAAAAIGGGALNKLQNLISGR